MKNLIVFFFATFLMMNLSAQETKADTYGVFLSGILSFEPSDINQNEPLIDIFQIAGEKANKTIGLNKENIVTSLKELSNFKHAIIIVGYHTIVKITDKDDCQQSGVWGACMPKGSGYVQKEGRLVTHEDYINFIIGIPDDQKRTLFLFM